MKKSIVSALVLAAIAAPSFAGVKVDVYNESQLKGDRASKQGIELGYAMDSGFGFGAEVVSNGEVELSTNYKWSMDNGFYLKPQVAYVLKSGKSEKTRWVDSNDIAPGTKDYTHFQIETFDGAQSDVFKAGLEAGYEFDFGLYTSVRYRVDSQLDATSLTMNIAKDAKGKDAKTYASESGERSTIGRTDIALGYKFDALTVQAKAIHKSEINSKLRPASEEKWGSEIKATLTAFDGVAPYAQLSSGQTTSKGFDENNFKLGVAFSF